MVNSEVVLPALRQINSKCGQLLSAGLLLAIGLNIPVESRAASVEKLSTVYTAALQADNKLIIGGDFTLVNGAVRRHLARLNPDGSLDSWNPNCDGVVYSVAISSNTVYVGGIFTNIGGGVSRRLGG